MVADLTREREPVRSGVAIDSNVLTYLAEAMTRDYEPAKDPDALIALERVASIRVFLYCGDVSNPPTTDREIQAITHDERRVYQEQIRSILIPELANLDGVQVAKRTKEFLEYHDDQADCSILAETEVGSVAHLLTVDHQLKNRLGPHSPVVVQRPTEYWTSLGIPHGARPAQIPDRRTPLARAVWWVW